MALTLTAVSEFKSTPYWLHIKPEWIGKQTPVSTMQSISMLRDRSKTSSQAHAARFVFKLAFLFMARMPRIDIVRSRGF